MRIQDQPTAPENPQSTGVDSEVARAMENYLARVEHGKAPDLEAFVAQYPVIADRLRICLSTLQFVEQAAILMAAAETAETPESGRALGLSLGDFRIIREIGRGGMGMLAPPQGGREG